MITDIKTNVKQQKQKQNKKKCVDKAGVYENT